MAYHVAKDLPGKPTATKTSATAGGSLESVQLKQELAGLPVQEQKDRLVPPMPFIAPLATAVQQKPVQMNGPESGTAAPAPTTASTPAPTYDPVGRSLDQLWDDCADPTKRPAAIGAMVGLGLQRPIVEKILEHDNGKTPRPIEGAAQEDALGSSAGAHISSRHVLDGAGDIGNKFDLAMRVLRHKPTACPDKAGAFKDAAAAATGMAAALKAMDWKTLRNRIARAEPIEEDIGVATTGEVLAGAKVLAKALPPYIHPEGEGGRPVYPGDPGFVPSMAPYQDSTDPAQYFKTIAAKPGRRGRPGTPEQKIPIAYDPSSPLTTDVGISGVHLRIIASPSAPGGFFIHSAWPY